MSFSKLGRGEILAAVAGIALAVAVFLPAYSPNLDNPNAKIDGARHAFSIWEANGIIRYLLLIAAAAPIILLYIVLRDNELSWPRGELTAVIGLIAITLLFYLGVISRPGDPKGEISLGIGWYLAILSAIVVAVGGAIRSAESERRRKPPGVL